MFQRLVDAVADLRPQAVPRGAWVIAVIAWWPVAAALGVAVLPLFVSYYLLINALNFCRASRWSPIRAVKLCYATVAHIGFMVVHAPLFASVGYYYMVAAPKDHVKKGVVYVTGPNAATPTELCLDVYYMSRARRAATARANARGPTAAKKSALTKEVLKQHGAVPGSPVSGTTSGSLPASSISELADDTASADSSSCGGAAHASSCSLPASSSGTRRPVAIFVYGGAWGSGARWYYARVAATLRDATGAVVVVPDYAAYPDCGIAGMAAALHHASAWVHDNIAKYGGDPHDVTLVGHSAGAQLCMMYGIYRGLAAEGIDPTTGPVAAELKKLLPEPTLGYREPIPFISCLPRIAFGHPRPRGASPADLLRTLGSEPQGCAEGLSSAVDPVTMPPIAGIVLFAGCYDIQKHVLTTETRRGVELISPASGAPCGFWGACSPTPLLRALEHVGKLGAVMRHVPAHIDVYHPQLDTTVTVDQSEGLVEMLNAAVAAVHELGQQSVTPDVVSAVDPTVDKGNTTNWRSTSPQVADSLGRPTTPGDKATVVLDNALVGNSSVKRVHRSMRPSAGATNSVTTTTGAELAEAAVAQHHAVHMMPGLGHADVIIGPMLAERPLHPSIVAVARAVLHRRKRNS